MRTEIPHDELIAGNWSHFASDWYYYSPSWGRDTHIHIGGNNSGGKLRLSFISLKVKDRFAGKVYDADRLVSDWGLLEDPSRVPYDVAIEFRKALKVAL